MNLPIAINQILQKDNHTFLVIWSDGKKQEFRLSQLQEKCPCANCRDKNNGNRLLNLISVKEDVKAFSIRNVGRYALQIHFNTGCSMGIYSFEMLRQMEKE
ncbi:DUF971 domain-containing protein [Candidatus Protochlamydia sp. W-9]|uniref:DUF971 domain-containing protein n=1 Tax=Candidatus Protochlamydia sp. W-9 TaxID=1785087 RepID=UPI001D0585BB|nr:DUF971 domain-containing protein [Candidatus Protochlamydia sp. W-9]